MRSIWIAKASKQSHHEYAKRGPANDPHVLLQFNDMSVRAMCVYTGTFHRALPVDLKAAVTVSAPLMPRCMNCEDVMQGLDRSDYSKKFWERLPDGTLTRWVP